MITPQDLGRRVRFRPRWITAPNEYMDGLLTGWNGAFLGQRGLNYVNVQADGINYVVPAAQCVVLTNAHGVPVHE